MTIVRTTYRYKRPPRKKPQAAAIEGPVIVTIRDSKRRNVSSLAVAAGNSTTVDSADNEAKPASPPATERKSEIVTIRRRGMRYPDLFEMTPEEHKRHGDAADALWRGMKRRIAEKLTDRS